MNGSEGAARLLLEAKAKQHSDWLVANLLTAAAVRLVVPGACVIVGGTAEGYWTDPDVYHPTDLDIWTAVPVHRRSAAGAALDGLGFTRDGRHWELPGLNVPIEFVSGPLAGSPDRLHEASVGGESVPVIGLDDLYLDRLRQSTANEIEDSVEFMSALSVAAHRYDAIDWRFVAQEIAKVRESNAIVGGKMERRNRRIRARVRRRLSEA